jgi:hypothetical protein
MRRFVHLALTAAAFTFVSCLRADFVAYYSFPPSYPTGGEYYHPILAAGPNVVSANTWSIYSNNDGAYDGQGTPYVFVSGDATTLTLDAGALHTGISHFSILEVRNTAPSAGYFSFDYKLTLGTLLVSHGYYLINGTHFALPAGTGSLLNVPLNAGDIFGFGVDAGPSSIPNQLFAQAIMEVSNFSAPVPEPQTLLLVGIGLVMMACARRRRI